MKIANSFEPRSVLNYPQGRHQIIMSLNLYCTMEIPRLWGGKELQMESFGIRFHTRSFIWLSNQLNTRFTSQGM